MLSVDFDTIKLHPAIVHFPIALLLIAGLFGGISLFIKREFWKDLMLKCFVLGIIFAPIAVITGLIEEQNLKHDEVIHEILITHKFNGLILLFFFQALAVWYWFRRQVIENKEYILWVSCLLLGSALILFQGYTGGEMVFGKGAGVKPMEHVFESEEESGSGHHHEKNDESKSEMKHRSMDSLKTNMPIEHKINSGRSMHDHAKDPIKKEKNLKI